MTAGCSEVAESDDFSATSAVSTKSDKIYRLKEADMPSDNALAVSPLGDGWLAALGDFDAAPEFYMADGDFGKYTPVEIPLEKTENTRYTVAMCPNSDGTAYIAVTAVIYEDDSLDYSSAEFSRTMYRIGTDGSVISQTALSGMGETEIYGICSSGDKVYVSADTVYEANGSDGTGKELGSAVYGGHLGSYPNGDLCYDIIKETDSYLKIGEKMLSLQNCGSPVSNISGGNGFDAVFATNTGIFGISGNEITELASIIGLGLRERSISAVYPFAEGIVVTAFDSVAEKNKIYILTDEEIQEHEQVTLKMGIFYEEDDFSAFLARQNGSDSYVKIEPVYYTRYDVYDKSAGKQVSTGLDQLNIDIISGNAPDMAVFMDTPQYLSSKGTFADLYTLMDDELSRDDFLPNILEAFEEDGKLYSLPTSFCIRTMMCKDKFSPVKNQTFDDMLRTYENAPAGIKFTPDAQQSQTLTDILYGSDFAGNGKIGIDRENMLRLLEFCGTLPAEYSEEYYDVGDDKALFSEFSAYQLADFSYMYEKFGEPVTVTGYPTENGNGTMIDPIHTVVVFDSCSDKESAWELMKCMYGSTNILNGRNAGFPVKSDAFYKRAELSKNILGENYDRALETVTSAVHIGSGMSHELYGIIHEEASGYFAGEYTAEQAADYIKNRTDIYISEKE